LEALQQDIDRLGGAAVVDMIAEMRSTQKTILAKLNHAETFYFDQAQKIDSLMRGFPDGDIEGHRRYHQSVIEWRELRNQMVKAALVKMAQAGALAATGWLCVAIWRAFKISVQQ
jgi:hypothetical protein